MGWKYNSPLRKTCCTLLTIVSIRLSQRALLLLQPPHVFLKPFTRRSAGGARVCPAVEPVALQLSRYMDTGALPGGAVPAVGPPGWSKAKSKANEVFVFVFCFFRMTAVPRACRRRRESPRIITLIWTLRLKCGDIIVAARCCCCC